jgi:SAM-dependent methyltransferase
VLGSRNLSMKTSIIAAMHLLILGMLQLFGPEVGWPQEPPQARIGDEMTKQETIYRSHGADAPKGYITDRGLSDYAELLPAGFCDALGSLGGSDRWLDIGAGSGQAILDYLAPEDDAAPIQKCSRLSGRAGAVAISIEDRQTDNWRRQAANLGSERIRYLSGKRMRDYSREELGRFQIITDVYGGFSYTDDLSRFVEKTLSLLDTGGAFYTVVQGVHLDDVKEKPGTWYETELVDAAGQNVQVYSWLKKISCVKVSWEPRSDWASPTALIKMSKVCSDVSVPPVKLLKYEAGNPPARRFQLEK